MRVRSCTRLGLRPRPLSARGRAKPHASGAIAPKTPFALNVRHGRRRHRPSHVCVTTEPWMAEHRMRYRRTMWLRAALGFLSTISFLPREALADGLTLDDAVKLALRNN